MITDIVFDFFGTLVEYSRSVNLKNKMTSYEYLRELGIDFSYEEFISTYDESFIQMENTAKAEKTEFHMIELGEFYFKKMNIEIDDDQILIFTDKFMDDWNSMTIFFDKIKELIEELSRKYRLSILSNTHYPEVIHENLEKMGIKDYFHKIYTSVEIGIQKPNKEIFNFLLQDLDISADKAIFVGDSYKDDYLGAKSVHMHCFLIDNQRKHPELGRYSIENLFALKEIL